MGTRRILITGGGGFVGSHLADTLLDSGHEVRVLDNFSPQVHGDGGRPDYLAPEVEVIAGDVRDPKTVRLALEGVDAVYHLAATVGVGQSMYELVNYTNINADGTAVLLEALAQHGGLERLVVASSMSIYGEGLYRRADGTLVPGKERSLEALRAHDWEVHDGDGEALTPVATPESKFPALPSVYALSKYYQERLCLTAGRAYGIPTTALRFFNIFGTRQALSNPYTGVLAIFAARFLNDKPPLINEDGEQRRDFVSVRDIAQACRLALEVPAAADQVFNVGSGCNYSVREIAEKMARVLGKEHIEPEIVGRCRVGDIRNCFADITRARDVLGYRPEVTLEAGLEELAEWLEGQTPVDRVVDASRELQRRGLAV